MDSTKLTDYLTFHNPVGKFHVAKGAEGVKAVFISIGSGGKGSEYIALTPEQALELARYLIVEANKGIEGAKPLSKSQK